MGTSSGKCRSSTMKCSPVPCCGTQPGEVKQRTPTRTGPRLPTAPCMQRFAVVHGGIQGHSASFVVRNSMRLAVRGSMRQRAAACGGMLRHAAACGGMRLHAAAFGGMRRHAVACDGMRRHAAACGGMRRHAAACPPRGAFRAEYQLDRRIVSGCTLHNGQGYDASKPTTKLKLVTKDGYASLR